MRLKRRNAADLASKTASSTKTVEHNIERFSSRVFRSEVLIEKALLAMKSWSLVAELQTHLGLQDCLI